MSAPTCRHCGHDDVVGPYTMDGYKDGEYREDHRWIMCRRCNRHTYMGTGS